MNFRGDLGQVTGGIGCSDLAWRRERSVIGHNEDGAPENVGQCALLTLALDVRPAVTAFWYPGFLPSNAFTVTSDGLVWSIDHLPVAAPGDGAARHFVGRGLQRSARTVDEAVGYLRTHPSAGGFAYTIGDRAGRIVSVEAAAGRHAFVEVGACWSPTSPGARRSSPPGMITQSRSRWLTWPKATRAPSARSQLLVAARIAAEPVGFGLTSFVE